MENITDLSGEEASTITFPEMTLFDLPLDIHHELFSHMDIHDQTACREAWQTWSDFSWPLHVRVDLNRCAVNSPQMLSEVLEEMLSQSKSLVLCETRPRMDAAQLRMVVTVLRTRGIRLRMIILSHCYRWFWLHSMPSGDPMLRVYAELQDVCDKLYWRLEHPLNHSDSFCVQFNVEDGSWYHVRHPDTKLKI